MKLSDLIAKYLYNRGVSVIFGYQGGSITHMIDSFDRIGIKYIQSYNEQGAGLAADAYARVSEIGFGVAIGTNGPGATNLITAVANAYCDSVPVLFFTGQVHTFAMKKDSAVRQESFQEIDIISMIKPITKYAVTIMNPNDAIPEIDRAINTALDGRKGPVVIDIPVDIQGMDVEDVMVQFESLEKNSVSLSYFDAINTIKESQKPLIIVGGGVRESKSCEAFRQFINAFGIPVVCSLMGLDAVPHESKYFKGFIGSYGNRYANLAIQNADVILAIGSRLDMRQTGKRRDLFAPSATIIHIDIDDSELQHSIKKEIPIKSDINIFLSFMNEHVGLIKECNWHEWIEQINTWKELYRDDLEFETEKENNPNYVVKRIGEMIDNHSVISFDVGQNQMWAAQSLRVKGDDIRILNSGGLGTMGYSLPAAIGAYYANPSKLVIALMGDGGLQMNIQELQMVANYHIPIKLIVFKNNALGLIRDVHEKYYEKRYVGSVFGFSVPPLELLARTYQMKYIQISNNTETSIIEEALRDDCAWIIEIELNGDTYTRPELLGPDALDKQSPYKEITEG